MAAQHLRLRGQPPLPPGTVARGPAFEVAVLAGGLVRAELRGALGEDEARAFVGALGDALAHRAEPLRALLELRRAPRQAAARRVLAQLFVGFPPGHVAAVGAGWRQRWRLRRAAANTLVRELRFFASPEAAEAWLRAR